MAKRPSSNSPVSPRRARLLRAIEKYKTHDLSGREALDYLRSTTAGDPTERMTSEEFIVKTMSKDGVLAADLCGKTAARCPADAERFRRAADNFGVVIQSEAAVERSGGRPKKYKSKKAATEARRLQLAEASREYRKRSGAASSESIPGAIDSTRLPDTETSKAGKCLNPQTGGEA
jgi:hypothetical protein